MPKKTETTVGEQRPAHWFKPGQSGNPKGRPKGARHRLGTAFIEALESDFTEHGKQAIEIVREQRPQDYLKVVASLLPKELNIKVDPLEELTEDELDQRIRQLAAALSVEIGTGEGAGAKGKEKKAKQPSDVSTVH